MEFPKTITVEGRPEVGHAYLGTFEKTHAFAILKAHHVIETGEILCKNVDQSSCRVIGSVYALLETALILLQGTVSKNVRSINERKSVPRIGYCQLLEDMLPARETLASLLQLHSERHASRPPQYTHPRFARNLGTL